MRRESYAAIGQWAQDQDITLIHRLGFMRRPAKSGGIRKVLIALDRKAFEHALTRWAEALLSRPIAAAASLPEAYALDGKSARGSFDGLQKAVHLLSLLAHESGLTLAQAAVPNGGEDKTNEHKAALPLLEGLVLQGRPVTGDAISCQRFLPAGDRCGGRLPGVRQRQPTDAPESHPDGLRPSREGLFPPRQQQFGITHGHGDDPHKGHGRIERRTLKATTALNDFRIGRVLAKSDRSRARWSRTARPARDPLLHHQCFEAGGRRGTVAQWARGHWSVENRSHYVRDVTMGEDASRIRKRSGPEVMAAFRNATIGLLRPWA